MFKSARASVLAWSNPLHFVYLGLSCLRLVTIIPPITDGRLLFKLSPTLCSIRHLSPFFRFMSRHPRLGEHWAYHVTLCAPLMNLGWYYIPPDLCTSCSTPIPIDTTSGFSPRWGDFLQSKGSSFLRDFNHILTYANHVHLSRPSPRQHLSLKLHTPRSLSTHV